MTPIWSATKWAGLMEEHLSSTASQPTVQTLCTQDMLASIQNRVRCASRTYNACRTIVRTGVSLCLHFKTHTQPKQKSLNSKICKLALNVFYIPRAQYLVVIACCWCTSGSLRYERDIWTFVSRVSTGTCYQRVQRFII